MRVRFRAGDTFWKYSQLFRIPLNLIVDSNRGLDPANIRPGQEVQVPGFVLESHTVRPGDTFWNLALQRGLPLEAMLIANPGVDPAALRPGMTVNVPLRVTWRVVDPRRPYDFAAFTADFGKLADLYPFMAQRTIGRSVMNKPLTEIRVGRGGKRVHANGAFHANEWITTCVLMQFLNDYALALTNNGSIRGLVMAPFYETTMLSVVPMVNPDGVDLVINGAPAEEPYRTRVLDINEGSANFSGWKANIRGVDLNDQFPARWDLEAARGRQRPAPRDYAGEAPLTEPEALAMAEMTSQGDFLRVLAFHTQGEVIYWGFENLEPPESQAIVREFARVSGYEPVRTIESYAGYKDWFIQDWRRPGFTIEAGFGVNPLPIAQFDEIYEECLGILLANLYL